MEFDPHCQVLNQGVIVSTILAFRGISKSFGELEAVSEVSLEVREGEILSLLGPSGCGKTTLLRIAGGFLLPNKGAVYLQGEDITHVAPDKRKLNTIFQSYALFPHMTVRDNIAFGPRMAGWEKPHLNQEVNYMLELVQLTAEAMKKPAHLSGGQKQRVALARALILKPKVLLLDEPFAAMDLKLRQRMLLELERLQREVGITFVFVTHDQHEAMSISDRIAVMQKGVIVQLGTPPEIYEKPINRFVASFIGDTNLLKGVPNRETGQLHMPNLPPLNLPGTASHCDNPLTLCLRPGMIQISTSAPTGTGSLNVVPAVIRERVYLGSQTRYELDVGPYRWQSLRTSTGGDEGSYFKPGTEVFASWLAEDGYILPESDSVDS